MVLSFPVVMIICLNEDYAKQTWTFPKTLLPLSSTKVRKDGLICNLVGLALFKSSFLGHFITRLLDADGHTVFNYNNMNGGMVIEDPNTILQSHLTSKYIALPSGFQLSIIYRTAFKPKINFSDCALLN